MRAWGADGTEPTGLVSPLLSQCGGDTQTLPAPPLPRPALSSLGSSLPRSSFHRHAVQLTPHWTTPQPAPSFLLGQASLKTMLPTISLPEPQVCRPTPLPETAEQLPRPWRLGSSHQHWGAGARAQGSLSAALEETAKLPVPRLVRSAPSRSRCPSRSLSLTPWVSGSLGLRLLAPVPLSLASPSPSRAPSPPSLSLARPGGGNRSVNRRMARGAPGADTRF